MAKQCFVSLLAIALLTATARAEVYEWSDSDGARHFTNSLKGVPAQYQNAATVIVADWAPNAADAPTAPASAPAATVPAAQADADVTAAWNEAYVAGLRAAADLGGGGGAGGNVQISGPLAVATTYETQPSYPADVYPPYACYGPYGYYQCYGPWPWYYPLVTIGFDRGRLRGLPLRRQLGDHFQIGRGGPFAFQSPGFPGGVRQFGRATFR